MIADKFHTIYVEKEAYRYELTSDIINRLTLSKVIEIGHYKNVFSKSGQDFILQKKAQKMILAVDRGKLIYDLPEVCQSFGRPYSYYVAQVLNCMSHCDYCHLQGMYNSGHLVVFVNTCDYFSALDKLSGLKPDKQICIYISFESDLLALEGLLGLCRAWLYYAEHQPNMLLELRTKSSNFATISDIRPSPNVILAWTLSPEYQISHYEKGTAALGSRINAIRSAIRAGWQVRLCFDPLLYFKGYEESYINFFAYIFSMIDTSDIRDVSIGTFRMPSNYFRQAKKACSDSELYFSPFVAESGVYSYSKEISEALTSCAYREIAKHMDESKIFQS